MDLNRLIPGLGEVRFRAYLSIGQVQQALEAAESSPESEQSMLTDLILATLVEGPQFTAAEMAQQPPGTFTALTEAAVEILEIEAEYSQFESENDVRKRFRLAFLESERKSYEGLAATLNNAVSELVSTSGFSVVRDAIASMAALDLKITEPLLGSVFWENRLGLAAIASDILPSKFDFMSDFASKVEIASGSTLASLVESAARLPVPEPWLPTALAYSGLDAPMLHSPTWISASKAGEIAQAHDDDTEEAISRKRLVDAYDILCELEQSLRTVIEVRLKSLHGDQWWKRSIPNDVREGCEGRKLEKEADPKAGHHPLAYAYMHDYRKIIVRKDNWANAFRTVFGNATELEACFKWVGDARDSIAHSRPIDSDMHMMFVAGARWIQVRLRGAKLTENTAAT